MRPRPDWVQGLAGVSVVVFCLALFGVVVFALFLPSLAVKFSLIHTRLLSKPVIPMFNIHWPVCQRQGAK
jgi:hypothetical protein